MIKTLEEARKTVLKKIPGARIESEHEMNDCFVINLVPIRYRKSDGIFCGGSIRVDKNTGAIRGYNPTIERFGKRK